MAAVESVLEHGLTRVRLAPVRPITVVVPFPAGGPSDVVARAVTDQMGKILGQSLVIENVGGGTSGSARVAGGENNKAR